MDIFPRKVEKTYSLTRLRVVLWGTAALIFLVDMLTKNSVRHFIPAEGWEIVPGISLRLFENTRGPFGVGPIELATVMGAGVLLFWVWFLLRMFDERQGWVSPIAVGLLLGGGLSNGLERVFGSRTTDIVWFGELTALNVADAAILIALLLLCITTARGFLWSQHTEGSKSG